MVLSEENIKKEVEDVTIVMHATNSVMIPTNQTNSQHSDQNAKTTPKPFDRFLTHSESADIGQNPNPQIAELHLSTSDGEKSPKPFERLLYGENIDIRQRSPSPQLAKLHPSTSAEENSPSERENRQTPNDPKPAADCSDSRKLTNFSIDQILRADFGPKRCRRGRHDDRLRQFPWPGAMTMSAASPSTLFSPLPCPMSRLFSAAAFSAFSPPASKRAFVHQPLPSRMSPSEKYYHRNTLLTPPPSSPESSTSSLSPSSAAPSSTYHISTSSPKNERLSVSQVSATSTVTSSGSPRTAEVTSSSLTSAAKQLRWPAWVYCTRYSDRPSSGPRYRKPRQGKADKRPRTAFSTAQLQRLRSEFHQCPYLSEARRIALATELGLSESQVKIWFQNKRAKLKKGCGIRNPLAQMLMEEGLYNHSTVILRDDHTDITNTITTTITNNSNNSYSSNNSCAAGEANDGKSEEA